MSAGTLTLANNSDVVAGIDTSFTTDLSTGDFIVVTTGGVTYTLPVKTIESDTALTLARNYNGPAVTAGAWTAMPRDTLNRISAQIAADTAYAIRQRVLEIDNWYQLLEVNGDVTIRMADGSTYTGPSWLKLIETMNNPSSALDKNKNLSDLTDREQAWLNVRPTGPTELAEDPVSDKHATTMGWVKTFVAAVKSVLDSWSIINSNTTMPGNGTSVKGGKVRSVYLVDTVEKASVELQASLDTSSAGVRTVTPEIVINDSTGSTTQSNTAKLLTSLDIGTSGAKVPLLSGNNNFTGYQTAFVDTGAWRFQSTVLPASTLGSLWSWSSNNASGASFFTMAYADGTTTNRAFINLPTTGGTLALQGTSGINFKHDITDADANEALDRVMGLRMVNFVYNDDEENRVRFGIIAEEAEKIAPQYIKHNSEVDTTTLDKNGNEVNTYRDRPSVDNNPIVMDLLGCVHVLKMEIDALKAEIAGLKS